jgi:hypothetical protein
MGAHGCGTCTAGGHGVTLAAKRADDLFADDRR